MDTRQQVGRVGVAGCAHPTACFTACTQTRPARRRCWHPAPSCPHVAANADARSRQQCAMPQAATTGQSEQPLTQLIADVLNTERAQTKPQGDVLSVVDAMAGRQFVTTVSRAWEGKDAWLEVRGRYQNCTEARKFALLAVHHERVWLRNQQLARLFQLVVQHRPGVIPAAAADRVASSILMNGMSGATEALQLPELLQLGVCFLPLATLESVISTAAEHAWQQLRAQPWAARQGLGLGPLSGQLAMMATTWRYQLSCYVIKLHHVQGINATMHAVAKLQQAGQPTAARSRSLWIGDSKTPSSFGDTSMFSSSNAAAPSTDIDAAAGIANYVAGQLGAYVKEGCTGPLSGRCGLVMFGRGGPPKTPTSSSSSAYRLLSGGGLARGAIVREQGCEGTAGFGAAVLREFRDVYVAFKDKEAATAQHESVLQNVALAYEAVLRSHMMDALCSWAETQQAALVPLNINQAHCTHTTRIVTDSQDHVSRVTTIGVSSTEGSSALPWLRQQALQQGRKVLQGWDPYLGNPFKKNPEWQYRNDSPAVWNRLVHPPAALDSTHLTLFWRQSAPSFLSASTTTPTTSVAVAQAAQPRTDHGKVTLTLSQADLQAFMATLLDAVAAVTSVTPGGGATSRGKQPGAWLGPVCLQMRYNPVVTAGRPVSGLSDEDSLDCGKPMAGQRPSDFEVRWLQSIATTSSTDESSAPVQQQPDSTQYQTARLTQSHIQSLINIYEDVSNRLPDILPVPQLPMSLTIPQEVSAPAATLGQTLVQAAVRAAGLLALAAAIPLAMTAGSQFEWSRPAVAWVGSRAKDAFSSINSALSSTVAHPTGTQDDVQQQLATAGQWSPQQGTTSMQMRSHVGSSTPAWQPIDSSKLDKGQLAQLCRAVQARVDKVMWLPLRAVERSEARAKSKDAGTEQPSGANTVAAEQQYEPLELKYQVVVASDARILGCMPCDPTSAHWYSHLPLSTAFRSLDSQQKQQRFLDACQPEAAKQELPGSLPALGSLALYIPLPITSHMDATGSVSSQSTVFETAAGTASEHTPEADVIVLLLTLSQDTASKALIGKGKNAKECAPMQATVTAWTDLDSAATWASQKAVVINRKKPRKSQATVSVAASDGSTTSSKITLPAGSMGGLQGAKAGVQQTGQGSGQLGGSVSQGTMSQVEQLLQHVAQQLAEQAAQQQQQQVGATDKQPPAGSS